MDPTYVYTRRSSARAWLMLVATGGAVLLLLVLIAVACRAGDGGTPTAGQDPASDQAVDDDAGGGAGQAGEGEEPESDGPGGGPDGGPDGGPGGGDPGGPGGGDPGEGGPHDTWQPLTGVQVVEERHPVPSQDYVRTGVRCPEGKVVLNGGFRSVGPATWGDPFLLQESNPGTVGGGATSLWLVSVYNDSAIARFVDLFAVCADPPPGYEVIRHDADMDPSEVIDATPTCPAGKSVLGGGAQVVGAGSANFRTVISTSAPVATAPVTFGWKAVIGNGTPIARTIGFKAVCANTIAGLQMVSDDMTVAPASTGTTTTGCPAGTVIGGGLGPVDGDATQWIPETYPDTGSADWVGTVRNSAAAERAFRVWAICAPAG
jgi:hypothetical protein